MKAKTFENLIRKIVREEIDYALRREIKSLKEDLQNNVKSTIVEQPSPQTEKEPINASLKEQIMGKTTPNKEYLQYSKNDTLNDLLNETAQGDTNLDRGSSPVSVEGDFSTIGDMPVEAAPKSVVDAVTRDYSGLMEAMNKRNKK